MRTTSRRAIASLIAILATLPHTGHAQSAASSGGTGAKTGGQGFVLNGFVSQGATYTYANPTHWSNATTRLQLGTRGELGGGVKWRLGGRFDVDAVYAGSNFYRDEVKRDQRANFFWRETYLDFAAGGWDFRLGAQNVVWGEMVGLFFADVVSRRDLREFLLPSFDVIRQPQWAARAEYTKDDSHLELVWVPVPGYDNIGKPGSDFYPLRLPSPTSDANAAGILAIERPKRSVANSNYGARANTLVGGWDIAGFYYRSFAGTPTFYRVPAATPATFALQPRHDRIGQVGATMSKDFDQFVLRGEAIHTAGQRHPSTNPTATEGVVERSILEYIVGVEFPLRRETRLNVQAFQRHISGGENDLAVKTGGFGGSIFMSTKLTPTIEPQLLWVQTFQGAGAMLRPRVNWYPAKNTTVGFGFDIFNGPTNSAFGRYNNRDRVYTEVRYAF